MSIKHSGWRSAAPLIGILVLVILLAAGGFLTNQYLRPLPTITTQIQLQAERQIGTAPSLPWSSVGSSAVAVRGFGLLGTYGDEAPRPIASTTKIMTALITLENHPLELGQQGPSVTITQEDVADYWRDISQDQSAVPLKAGEKFSELQLLEGLLIPSGNNIADLLAKWVAGSEDVFVAKMNARAAALGLSRTHYADASGFSAESVSTPSDLLALSAVAMENPVFRQIVSMPQTTLPGVGEVRNVNSILGKEGNIGIKTGWTDEAGGCFVSASIQQVAGKPTEVYAAVLGQDERDHALDSTIELSKAVASSFQQVRVMNHTDIVATLSSAWGDLVGVVPAQDVDMLAWPGTKLTADLQLNAVQAPLSMGTKVGEITLKLGNQTQTVDAVTTAPITEPSWRWRTTRFLRGQ